MDYNLKRSHSKAKTKICKAITASDVVCTTWKCNGVTNSSKLLDNCSFRF